MEIEPNNVKSLFRKGQALAGMKDYMDAIRVLRQAEALEPENKEVKQFIEKVRKSHEVLKQKQAKAFAGMFGVDDEDTKKST